jgi:DNA-binding NarL/FixJ family response regulator
MAHANRIRILVLHADPCARAGLSTIFARYPDLEVVNDEDESGEDCGLLHGAPCNRPDVIVADYVHGIELASQGSRRAGAVDGFKIMIVASSEREWEIRSALEHGVRGYALFGCALDELASGVRAVNRGVRHLSPSVAQRLAESLSGEPLTGREAEVLRLVVDGMGNKAIARRLDIAVGTVKSHLKGIFDKLNVDSRTQAICATERRGLLGPAPQDLQIAATAAAAERDMPNALPSRLVERTLRAVVSRLGGQP